MRALFAVVVLVCLVAPVAAAQAPGQVDKLIQAKMQAKEQEIFRTLTQSDYKARMPIPASDSLFVDDGKLVEGMYNVALKNNKLAFKAGETVKVTKVVLLDFAVQIYFNEDTAIIGQGLNHANLGDLGAAEISTLAAKSIAAMFDVVKK